MSTLAFRELADSYEQIQSVRISSENQLRAIQQELDEPEDFRIMWMSKLSNKMREIEKELKQEMLIHLVNFDVYQEFLLHIKGVGPTLACKLLALGLDYDRPLTAWNAYFALTPHYYAGECVDGHKFLYAKDPLTCRECGQGIAKKEHFETAPKRIKGYRSFWNPKARTLIHLIGGQFIKGGRFYKEQYYKFKEREQKAHPDWTKLHIHNSANRKSVQLFLAHFYQCSLELMGREPRLPYQFDYLGHEDFIHWKEVVAYDKANKKQAVAV